MSMILRGVTLKGITISPFGEPPPPDVSPPPPSPTEFWAEYVRNTLVERGQVIKTLNDQIFSISIDPNVYTVFSVLKQDSLGNVLSSISLDFLSFPNISYVDTTGMAVDSDENVYALFIITFNNGNNPYQGITKTDTDGNLIWTIYIEITNGNSVSPGAISCSDNFLYLASTNNTSPLSNTLITQLDMNTGAIIWSNEISFSDGIRNHLDPYPHMTVDSDGNVIYTDQIYADDGTIVNKLWVAKIDPTGAFIWQKDIDHPFPDQEVFIQSIDTDPDGNIYIALVLSTVSSQLGVILTIDTAGAIIWSIESSTEIDLSGISYSADGLYLSGVNNRYNPYIVTDAIAGPSIYVVKFDPSDGTMIWNNSYYIPESTAYFDPASIDSEPGYYAMISSVFSSSTNVYSSIILRQRQDGVTNDFRLDKNNYLTVPDAFDFVPSSFSDAGDSTAILSPFDETSSSDFTPSIVSGTPDVGIVMTNDPPV
jgi:hypothetical protein